LTLRGRRKTLTLASHRGGSVVKINAGAYGCAAHKDRGPAVCGGVVANRAEVDRVVLEHVRGALTAPEMLEWIE
jgi:hypothetical protein